MSRAFRAVQIGSVSALAMLLATPSFAQEAPEDGVPVEVAAEEQAEASSEANPIVVTGSRISRAGYTAPTPVTVLGADQLVKTAPSNIPDALNQLPQFQGSISQTMQADTGASRVRSGNYLDIRALGTQRVLILQDGRRLPPTGNNGGTDSNLVPQMLVERVEVVTGGASAAYGSDAVSGVVNFILNKRFTGLQLNAQSGISTYGDNGSYKFGAAAGVALVDDRFRLIGSADHYYSDGITDRASRYTASGENTESAYTIAGLGTAAAPYYYVGNVHNNASAYGGFILSGPATLINQQFLPDGSVGPFVRNPTLVGRPGYGIGGDGVINPSRGRTGAPSLRTTQLFGRASFEVSPEVKVFAEVGYNQAKNEDRNATPGTPGTGALIFSDNAFLTPAVRAAYGSAASITIARPFAEWSTNRQLQKSHSTVINAGLEGELGGMRWEAYYTHGSSHFETASYGIDNRRFFAAVDAVRNPGGQIVCRVTLTNPGLYDGCVPLNIIGVGNASVEARNYVQRDSTWQVDNKLDLVAATLSATPFSLWAGPVGIAVGAEYRKQSLVQTSNSNPASQLDLTGLRGVTTPITNTFAGVNVGLANGSYNVKEVFAELEVPLLKDSAVGTLDLNGAARYTDYSTSGSVTTWKVGGTYNPVPDLRLRGTLSRDIRAPSLFELFAAKQQTTSPLTDLQSGLSQGVNVISSGNPALTPEIATTYTLGAVLSPQFIPGLNLSIDYYNIKIRDAIAQPFTYIQIADFCFNSQGTSPLCAQISRPSPTSFPSEIRLQNLNVANVQNRGIDFEASYRTTLGSGSFNTRLLATRLLEYRQQTSAQFPERQYAGNADFIQGFYPLPMPKWRGTLNVGYTQGPASISVQERYIGSYNISDIFQYQQNRIKGVFYTDVNMSLDVGGQQPKGVQVYMTVNNLFNQKGRLFLISPVPGLNIPTARSIYDIVGRYFTVGAKIGF